MNKRLLLSLLASASALLFSGCAATNNLSKNVVGYSLAAAGGSYLGGAIGDSDASKAIGAAAGVALYAAYEDHKSKTDQQKLREAYEQGKREVRAELGEQFWNEITFANGELVRENMERNKRNRAAGSETRDISADRKYINPYAVEQQWGPGN